MTKEIKWNNKELNKPKGRQKKGRRENKQDDIFKASHVKSTLNVNSIGPPSAAAAATPSYFPHKGRGCNLNKKASPNYMLPINKHFKQRHTNR